MPNMERLSYFHDMARELAQMAEADGIEAVATAFRMAQQAALELLTIDPQGRRRLRVTAKR